MDFLDRTIVKKPDFEVLVFINSKIVTLLTLTSSKPTIETLEKGVKYVQSYR